MKFLSIIISIMLLAGCYPEIDVGFSPSSYCEDRIVGLINSSSKSVDVAVYSINNNGIVEALLKASERGIPVRILTDRTQASGRSSQALRLYEHGLDLKIHSDFKIEHNKFGIFDGQTVSTGSFNWTQPASLKNSENCLFITNHPTTVSAYQNRFNELWKLNSKDKSDQWIQKKLNERKMK